MNKMLSTILSRYRIQMPDSLQAWIITAYWLFTAMQFVVSSSFVYTFWFFLAMMPPFLWLEWRCKGKHIKEMWHHPLGRWMLLLLGYTFFHAIFLTHNWVGIAKTLQNTFFTSIFLLVSVLALRIPQAAFTRLLTDMMYLIIIMGLAAIVWHIGYVGMTQRLEPFGRTHHAILGANVFAVFSLCGVYLAHPQLSHGKRMFLPILASVVVAILIALTQSRGPMISYAVAGIVALMLLRQYIAILIIVMVAAIIALDGAGYAAYHHSYLPLTTLYDAVLNLSERPSHRAGIWQMAIGMIIKQPAFGYGMQTPFSYGYGGVNPHNIFLSAFFYTGIIGGGLLLVIVGYALRLAWRHHQTPQGTLAVTLLVHAIFACMTDQGQYVLAPAPQWTIFWLPLTLVIAITLPYKNKSIINPDIAYKKANL